jgi:predicted transcriptional regulator
LLLIADQLSFRMASYSASTLLRQARAGAGLSQRGLAIRAGTSQSVVARIEGGLTDPSSRTLKHLLAAAGFELRAELTLAPVPDSHMLSDVGRILSLTPEQRLEEVRSVARFTWSARRV